MKTSVLGCGRWGSFIAWYLDHIGHAVTLYGRENSRHIIQYQKTRSNGVVTLGENVKISVDLEEALSSDLIAISIPSQSLREQLNAILQTKRSLKGKTFLLCMKGIEIESGMRLSEVFRDILGSEPSLAVWLGPGHVQEFIQGIPNCMVIDSDDEAVKAALIEELKGPLIRFYYGTDLIGNEIGAAAKNVIGIAAGILDGLSLSSLKGAMMSRATREISRLIEACGGKAISAYGLCHLGDYEATVFSPFSHNRCFGEHFAKNEPFPELAEGYFTAKAIVSLAKKVHVEIPICEAVYRILYENVDIQDTLQSLFLRSLKAEF